MKKILFIIFLFLSACVIAQPVSQLPKKYKSKGLGIWFIVSDSIRGAGSSGVMSGRSVDSLLTTTGNINTAISPLHKSNDTIYIDSATSFQNGYLSRWKFNLFNSKANAFTNGTGITYSSNILGLDTSFAATKNYILQNFVRNSGQSITVDLNNQKLTNVNFLGIGTSSLTPITSTTKLQIGDLSLSSNTTNALSLVGYANTGNTQTGVIYFMNTRSTATQDRIISFISGTTGTNQHGGRLQFFTKDSVNATHLSFLITSTGRVGLSRYPTLGYLFDVPNKSKIDSLYSLYSSVNVFTNTTSTIGTANITTENVTGSATYNANVIYPTTINSSLSGANARIPSHVYTSITFTNSGLTSIGSANNGGVVDGHFLFIVNGTGGDLTIVNNYGSAAAGEAINTGKGGNVIVPNGGTFALRYNGFASAWSFLGGGSTPVTNVTGKTSTGSGLPWEYGGAFCGEYTAISTDTTLNYFNDYVPTTFTITSVQFNVNKPQTSGSVVTFDILKNGTTIFSTKVTIDNTEYTSLTAATAYVLSTTTFTAGDRITIKCTQIGGGQAQGGKFHIKGTQ